MTPTQTAMASATGTTDDYEKRCWLEYDAGTLTAEEAAMKAHRYWEKFELAGMRDAAKAKWAAWRLMLMHEFKPKGVTA